MEGIILHLGDCLEVLRSLPENSIDALVTDPPYGIRFMGKAWDGKDIIERYKNFHRSNDNKRTRGQVRTENSLSGEAGTYDISPIGMRSFQEWTRMWAIEVLRVLKPGAHALVFCSPRSYHRMACGLEEAGFEIRDQIQWLFGQGFPKSFNLKEVQEGFGTALKPANEPICLARKPISEKTIADNVKRWGTGGINVDGCRIGIEKFQHKGRANVDATAALGGSFRPGHVSLETIGRFPANLVLSHTLFCADDECHETCAVRMLDEQSGVSKSTGGRTVKRSGKYQDGKVSAPGQFTNEDPGFGDKGGASRFFYCAKTSTAERNRGCEEIPLVADGIGDDQASGQSMQRLDGRESRKVRNNHPTVKPIKLMRYLCRLVTPPGGTILDPFMGSGTTGMAAKAEGFQFIGIEKEKEYFEIAQRRNNVSIL